VKRSHDDNPTIKSIFNRRPIKRRPNDKNQKGQAGSFQKAAQVASKPSPHRKLKSFKEYLSTKSQTFDSQTVEGEGDAFSKQKSLRERSNTKVLAFDHQTLEDEGDAFSKWKSLWEHPNIEASAFGKQMLECNGDAFLKQKRFKQSAIMQNKNRTTSKNKQHATIANKKN
jgi:hypothetical protein